MYHLHGVLATSHRLVIIIVNPYESASFVIGQTLAPFDDDNLIPCFGFCSCEFVSQYNLIFNLCSLCIFHHYLATTQGEEVLSLQRDNSLSHGVEDVLSSYRRFTPTFLLSGIFPLFSNISTFSTKQSRFWIAFVEKGQYRMNCSSMLLSTLLNRATASFMFWWLAPMGM